MVLIEYVGLNDATMTWDAPSHNRYRFGGNRRLGYVHTEDLNWFLAMRKNTRVMFKRAQEPEAVVPEPPDPQPKPKLHEDLTIMTGVADTTETKLKEGGYLTIEEIAEADAEEMAELTGIVTGYAERYIKEAKRVLDRN